VAASAVAVIFYHKEHKGFKLSIISIQLSVLEEPLAGMVGCLSEERGISLVFY
jgi:hypothetical protein